MTLPRDLEAEVYYFTSQEGGRSNPVADGYRGQFHYDGEDWVASHTFPNLQEAPLGTPVRTYVAFMSPSKHVGRLSAGTKFLIREGGKTVGKGVVKKIVELEESARREIEGAT